LIDKPKSKFVKRIRVLHIDDDKEQLDMLQLFFEATDQPIDVTSTTETDQVLKLIQEKKYDCIVSDYKMPEMTGIELAKRIREKTDIPIILYTGQGSEEVAEAAFSIGVNDYVRKELQPSHYSVLAKRIIEAAEKKRTEILYQRVVDETSDALAIIVGSKIKYANRSQAKLLGLNGLSELIDTDIREWILPKDRTEFFNRILDCQTQNVTAVVEIDFLRKDGVSRPVETSLNVIEYESEKSIIAFSRDITERKKMERELQTSERKFRNIVELSPDGIIMTSKLGNITFVNPTFEKITGFSNEEIVGKHILNISTLTKSDALRYFKLFLQLSQGGKIVNPIEFNFLKKNKTKGLGKAYFNISYDEDNEREFFAVLRDITEQKKTEKELEKYSMNLEQLILDSISDRVYSQQEIAIEKASEILANRLREPLNAIKNALYVIEQHPEKVIEMVDLIKRAVDKSVDILEKQEIQKSALEPQLKVK
jgi:PAS domain S-box-containing protein